MRKEEFGVGSCVHVIKRGARGAQIVRDDHDKARFLKLLRYLNDANVPRNWEREINEAHIRSGYVRPEHWPIQEPYVSIVSFCLLDNHFHILLQERVEGGVSKFMHRLCTSMTAYFNARHQEHGTLFQGAYRARTIQDDRYLQYLTAYIQVKNVFELFPLGFQKAAENYDKAFDWAVEYRYASLADFISDTARQLVDDKLMRELLPSRLIFRRTARDMIEGRLDLHFTEADIE